jgi:hypothetical protein
MEPTSWGDKWNQPPGTDKVTGDIMSNNESSVEMDKFLALEEIEALLRLLSHGRT